MATSGNRGRLPDFIIVGAAKSGTSTLFDHLCHHSRVFGSAEKEPCFFDAAVAWNEGLDWYRSLFADAAPHQLCVEASTNYTRYPQVPGVPERIKETVPRAKLIYIVRDPVDRAYSHFVHRHMKELYPNQPFHMAFDEFVAHDPMCIDSSRFDLQIDRYLEHFPREQMLVLSFEELLSDPADLLERVQRFLDLPIEDLSFGGRAGHSNDGRRFRDSRVRAKVVAPLRRIPGAEALAHAVGDQWRERAVRLLMSSPWGGKVRQGFEPPPLSDERRAELSAELAPAMERVNAMIEEDRVRWRDYAANASLAG